MLDKFNEIIIKSVWVLRQCVKGLPFKFKSNYEYLKVRASGHEMKLGKKC